VLFLSHACPVQRLQNAFKAVSSDGLQPFWQMICPEGCSLFKE
jgi:hypothetical protein